MIWPPSCLERGERMSRTMIKLNAARLLLLRSAMKKEEQRLQNAASQVARIASGLEMEVAARANIDASLNKLRRELKQDAENMATMQKMADLAINELQKKDEDLAGRARNLNGTMRGFLSLAALSGVAGGAVAGVSSALLKLKSQMTLDAGERMGGLFGLLGDLADPLRTGVDLSNLTEDTAGTERNGGTDHRTGAAGALAGVAALGIVTSLWDQVAGRTNTGSAGKKQGLFDGLKSSLGRAADWVGDKASDAVDWVGDKVSDAKDAVKSGAKWVGNVAGKVWDGVKKVANVKPVQYVMDAGAAVVGTAADVGSFCANVLTGNIADATLDIYSVINDVFDVGQDLSALAIYGIGYGAKALGHSDDIVQECYNMAEDYANRDGLAGELGGAGWSSGEKTLEFVDIGVGAYKFGGGLSKFTTALGGMEWKDLSDLKDNLFSLSGWKSNDSLEGMTGVERMITQYANTTSNVKLGYKYADGMVDNIASGAGLLEEGSLLQTILKATSPGKVLGGGIKIVEDFTEFITTSGE